MVRDVSGRPVTDVAIGILKRGDRVCIAQRQAHQHLGGCWEFPGGKVEPGEAVYAALQREMQEELGVEVQQAQPLIVVPWQYEKAAVRLHVFVVETFSGEPHDKEGQTIRWCSLDALQTLAFPPANRGILNALRLPAVYMTIGSYQSHQEALQRFEISLKQGVKLAQLKCKEGHTSDFSDLVRAMQRLAHRYQANLLLNGVPQNAWNSLEVDGFQLSSTQASHYQARPVPNDQWLGVSVHTPSQIEHALRLEADFLLLSPVKFTPAHPDIEPLGWEGFSEIVQTLPVPVYALGGIRPEDLSFARSMGGQGVCLSKGLWPD